MQLQKVDMVGAEASQCRLTRFDDPGARAARGVRSVANWERHLGREQEAVAPAADRRAEHGLRSAVRVHVGGVEEVHAGIEADVHEPAGLVDIGCPPRPEQGTAAAERSGAEAQDRHVQAGSAKSSIFHTATMRARATRIQSSAEAGTRRDTDDDIRRCTMTS